MWEIGILQITTDFVVPYNFLIFVIAINDTLVSESHMLIALVFFNVFVDVSSHILKLTRRKLQF